MYDKDFVEAAIPLLWDYTATVQVAREDGMPSGAADPRKAQDPFVRMIDVRRAWDGCDWLGKEHRQALFAYGVCGTYELAAGLLDSNAMTVLRRCERGVELLTIWLNSTHADRAQWMQDLDDIEQYGHISGLRERELELEAE